MAEIGGGVVEESGLGQQQRPVASLRHVHDGETHLVHPRVHHGLQVQRIAQFLHKTQEGKQQGRVLMNRGHFSCEVWSRGNYGKVRLHLCAAYFQLRVS